VVGGNAGSLCHLFSINLKLFFHVSMTAPGNVSHLIFHAWKGVDFAYSIIFILPYVAVFSLFLSHALYMLIIVVYFWRWPLSHYCLGACKALNDPSAIQNSLPHNLFTVPWIVVRTVQEPSTLNKVLTDQCGSQYLQHPLVTAYKDEDLRHTSHQTQSRKHLPLGNGSVIWYPWKQVGMTEKWNCRSQCY
jgi:predicted membrane channel-forming protein YqfA (hemolysin III family)